MHVQLLLEKRNNGGKHKKRRHNCFIMIAYTAVTKLLIYPTALAELCGRDLLFPCLCFQIFYSPHKR